MTRQLTIALYVNAALLAAVVGVLLLRENAPSMLPAAYGQQLPPIAGGAGLFLMPGQLSSNSWGAYVMDVDRQTLMVYGFNPGERKLKLMAAREFTYDRRLRDFNTEMSPQDVKKMTDAESEPTRSSPPRRE